MTEAEVIKFIEYLAKNDIILAYWNPFQNELMPISYTAEALAKNFKQGKPAVSGGVKREGVK